MSDGDVLAVDVGATSIKSRIFDSAGEARDSRSKRPTPRPCTPARLVELLATKCLEAGVERLGVGFPGEVDRGIVLDAANLSRRAGPGSPVEPSLFREWANFDLVGELQRATRCEVLVENDAVMAARGCLVGLGVEMVLTLGTGCGFALARNGDLIAVRDLGGEELIEGSSFDEVLGEVARSRDEARWQIHVQHAIDSLCAEFAVDVVHLAGGNARRLSPHQFVGGAEHVVIERDDPALLGAWRSFHS